MNNKMMIFIAFIMNIIIIILAYFSFAPIFALSVYGELTSKSFSGNFRFFTNDGNLYSTLVSCILISFQITILFFKKNPNIIRNNILYLLSLASAVSELIILFVVLFVLLPMLKTLKILFGNFAMFNLHLLTPIIVTIRFLFFEKKRNNISHIDSLYGSLPVLVYGVIVLFLVIIKVFNQENNKIPYPFLNIYGNPWWVTFISIIGIFGFTFGLCILLNYLNQLFENVLLDIEERNINFITPTPSNQEKTYEL